MSWNETHLQSVSVRRDHGEKSSFPSGLPIQWRKSRYLKRSKAPLLATTGPIGSFPQGPHDATPAKSLPMRVPVTQTLSPSPSLYKPPLLSPFPHHTILSCLANCQMQPQSPCKLSTEWISNFVRPEGFHRVMTMMWGDDGNFVQALSGWGNGHSSV